MSQISLGSRSDGSQLEKVRCGNPGCTNPGTKSCARCKLVAYCSRACQEEHYTGGHKAMCLDPITKAEWKPSYLRNMDFSGFSSDPLVGQHASEHLWGNVPACNFSHGLDWATLERLDLCFAASGDLRNVIMSVNAVPDTFEGDVAVMINDFNPRVAARNFAMLLLLLDKGEEAAEAVLHLWYSVAVPRKHWEALAEIASEKANALAAHEGGGVWEVTRRDSDSTLTANFPGWVWETVSTQMEEGASIDLDAVLAQRRKQLLDDPYWLGVRERYLHGLDPYHRVSGMHFRRFGLLLPLGEASSSSYEHFDTPNAFLIHPELGWTLHNGSDPLEGWPFEKVVDSGRRHGIPKHDLYGALFVHVRETLRRFVAQLTRHRITIRMHCMDACQLASSLPGSVQFDRVELSNIVDRDIGGHYPGFERAIAPWAPHLKLTGVILAYFLNWDCMSGLRASLGQKSAKVKGEALKARGGGGPMELFMRVMAEATETTEFSGVDTCPEFREYLEQEDAAAVLRGLGLRLRERHEVVPPRFGVPVGAPWDAVPARLELAKSDPLQHYGLTRLHTGIMMSERYIEVVHQDHHYAGKH